MFGNQPMGGTGVNVVGPIPMSGQGAWVCEMYPETVFTPYVLSKRTVACRGVLWVLVVARRGCLWLAPVVLVRWGWLWLVCVRYP